MTAPPDLQRLQRWREEMASGGVHRAMLLKPAYEPGERLAAVLTNTDRARVPLGLVPLGPEQTPQARHLLFVTDRRVFFASGGTTRQVWRWEELTTVRVLRRVPGIALLNQDKDAEDSSTDILFTGHAVIDWTFKADPHERDQGWWQAQAAFFASRGLLDEWFERVRASDPTL